ncbi:MAG: PRC-barrel domain-containing protein [Acidimicrobiia bacterium]
MTEIWTWTITAPQPAPDGGGLAVDLAGYRVEATDGHIGDVDEATFDETTGSLVVDTGFWIFGKRRLVPVGLIDAIDTDERTIHLACTKAEVKDAPDYDPDRAGDDTQRDEVGSYFGSRRYEGMQGDPIGPQPGPGRS